MHEVMSKSTVPARAAHSLFGAALLAGLCLSSLYSYLLFHAIAEMFAVVIACGVFMIAWHSRRILDNNYLLFLGISSLFVAVIDGAHILSYKGMGVFGGGSSNPATQLWIAGRFVGSISLLVAPLFIGRRLFPVPVFAGFALAVTAVFLAIFVWQVFPVCYVEGVGQTPFKVYSEYAISLILAAALLLLWRKREAFAPYVRNLLAATILVTIASELVLTLYVDVYGLLNLLGHVLKIVAFFLLYKALIETGLLRPYDLLFRNLKRSEEALAQRARELEIANAELEAFSYSASHDLKTPLVSIEGYSSLLLEEPSAAFGEEEREYLERIQRASRTMAQMIDALLNFSRAGRVELHRTRVDLSQTARTVAAELERLAPERNVDFEIQQGMEAVGDESLLRLVLQNLLGNAWKYSAKRNPARIEFFTQQPPDTQERIYCVRDNGVGFDMAQAQKLFTPFERLHSSREFSGTGIGLSTVQRIISRHGGHIWAHAEVEQGASVYFTLPGASCDMEPVELPKCEEASAL